VPPYIAERWKAACSAAPGGLLDDDAEDEAEGAALGQITIATLPDVSGPLRGVPGPGARRRRRHGARDESPLRPRAPRSPPPVRLPLRLPPAGEQPHDARAAW
jgi:hypothetical protein